jgi:hypothetical protein
MTLIVVAAGSKAIALASDKLIQHGAGTVPTIDKKLFVISGRVCVASYGSGPPGVPAIIDAVSIRDGKTIEEAAEAIGNAFNSVPAGYKFGLIVAGFNGASPALVHVCVPERSVTAMNTSGWKYLVLPKAFPTLADWHPEPQRIDPCLTSDELLRSVEAKVREGYSLAPTIVSSELASAFVTAELAQWHSE